MKKKTTSSNLAGSIWRTTFWTRASSTAGAVAAKGRTGRASLRNSKRRSSSAELQWQTLATLHQSCPKGLRRRHLQGCRGRGVKSQRRNSRPWSDLADDKNPLVKYIYNRLDNIWPSRSKNHTSLNTIINMGGPQRETGIAKNTKSPGEITEK